MERDGRTQSRILRGRHILFGCAILGCTGTGCIPEGREADTGKAVRATITLADMDISSKSLESRSVDEVSLLVFDQDGLAERCITYGGDEDIGIDLISGRTYSFYALADFGYPVFADDISEMDELTYHLETPMEAMTREAFCGRVHGLEISEDMSVTVPMKRMTAKISIEMDRSRLAENVSLEITEVSIGNCPRQARVFGANRVLGESECFPKGYSLRGKEVSPLNLEDERGRSGKVSLFMLENMQGDISDLKPEDEKDKIFKEDDPRRKTCSYLEIHMNYLSQNHFSNGGPLIYRFYLGDGPFNVDIERNCHYRFTICPENEGLDEDSWRVDKTYIHEFGPSRFASFPDSYIRGDIGDTLHLYCEFHPPHTPFEIDLEELEYDKSQGIYDYMIDEDGHGVRLILTGPGTGIVYMEAGDPVNEAAMWVVEVNLPSTYDKAIDTLQYMSPCMTSTVPECRRRPGVLLHHRLQDQGR